VYFAEAVHHKVHVDKSCAISKRISIIWSSSNQVLKNNNVIDQIGSICSVCQPWHKIIHC